MELAGANELPLVLFQGRLFVAYGQCVEELINRADFIGYYDEVYHCKPRTGAGGVITIYYKLELTD